VLVDHVLEIGREVNLAGAGPGKASNASAAASTRRAAPRRRAVLLRATRDSSSSVFRSIFTSVRSVPSALMKPPCAVPVCTLILLRPTSGAALLQRALKPFM
jgi:hypothetical protein